MCVLRADDRFRPCNQLELGGQRRVKDGSMLKQQLNTGGSQLLHISCSHVIDRRGYRERSVVSPGEINRNQGFSFLTQEFKKTGDRRWAESGWPWRGTRQIRDSTGTPVRSGLSHLLSAWWAIFKLRWAPESSCGSHCWVKNQEPFPSSSTSCSPPPNLQLAWAPGKRGSFSDPKSKVEESRSRVKLKHTWTDARALILASCQGHSFLDTDSIQPAFKREWPSFRRWVNQYSITAFLLIVSIQKGQRMGKWEPLAERRRDEETANRALLPPSREDEPRGADSGKSEVLLGTNDTARRWLVLCGYGFHLLAHFFMRKKK